MNFQWRISYRQVKVYTVILMVCAFLGNDFLKFSFFGFPFNPFRLVGLVAPVVLLLAPTEFWRTLWRGGARYYVLFIGLLCGYALLSGLWGPDRDKWMQYTLFLLYGGLTTFLVIGCLDSGDVVVWALRSFVLCAAFVAVGALIEILSGHYWFNTQYAVAYLWKKGESLMHLPLPVFAMGNVNDFGSYLFMAFMAALWLFKDDTAYSRWYVAAGLLFVFLMLCTQSRSVFLALMLAGMAGFGCYLLRKPPHWKVWLGVACGAACLAIAAFVLFWLYDAPGGEVASDAVRMGVMRNAWLFFKPVWYRGLGWGGVDYYNLQYPVYTVGDVPHLHNWFLELLFSCGLFVFLYYLWVYVRAWWSGLHLVLTVRQLRMNAAAVRKSVWRATVEVAALSGFVGLSLASSSLVSSHWFWTAGALGFGVCDFISSGGRAGIHEKADR